MTDQSWQQEQSQQEQWQQYHAAQQQAFYAYQQQKAYEQQQRREWAAQGIAYNPDHDERTAAVLGHVGLLVLGFLAPLIILLTKGEESPYVKDQARESLNFVLTVGGALILTYILMIVGSFAIFPLFLLAPLLMVEIVLLYLMPILAALASNKGTWYRYPFIVRVVR